MDAPSRNWLEARFVQPEAAVNAPRLRIRSTYKRDIAALLALPSGGAAGPGRHGIGDLVAALYLKQDALVHRTEIGDHAFALQGNCQGMILEFLFEHPEFVTEPSSTPSSVLMRLLPDLRYLVAKMRATG